MGCALGICLAISEDMNNVTVYGADWCGDTRRTLRQLDQRKIEYDYVDIDANSEGEKKVIDFNGGKRRIPMVVIDSDNGEPTKLSVPTETELEKALG
jgi:mycoredoxin